MQAPACSGARSLGHILAACKMYPSTSQRPVFWRLASGVECAECGLPGAAGRQGGVLHHRRAGAAACSVVDLLLVSLPTPSSLARPLARCFCPRATRQAACLFPLLQAAVLNVPNTQPSRHLSPVPIPWTAAQREIERQQNREDAAAAAAAASANAPGGGAVRQPGGSGAGGGRKRGRGRPAGSKTKTRDEAALEPADTPVGSRLWHWPFPFHRLCSWQAVHRAQGPLPVLDTPRERGPRVEGIGSPIDYG